MQPTYLPWLGYFDLIDCCDIFVFLDIVQLARRSWQTRNRIMNPNKDSYLMLSASISKTATRDELLIKDAELLFENKWHYKHIKSIQNSYTKARYIDELCDFLSDYYNNPPSKLVDLNTFIITAIAKKIGISTKFLFASEVDGVRGSKDELLLSICKSIDADIYISPIGSAKYIELEGQSGVFKNQLVKLEYQNYHHPVYQQLSDRFISHLSIIDLIANHGFENTLEIVRSGRCQPYSSYDISDIQSLLKI